MQKFGHCWRLRAAAFSEKIGGNIRQEDVEMLTIFGRGLTNSGKNAIMRNHNSNVSVQMIGGAGCVSKKDQA